MVILHKKPRLPLRTQKRDTDDPARLRETILELEEEIIQLKRIVLPELVFPEKWRLTATEARLLTFFFTAPTGFRSNESLHAFMDQRALKAGIESRAALYTRTYELKNKLMDHGISFYTRPKDGIQLKGRDAIAAAVRGEMKSWLDMLILIKKEERVAAKRIRSIDKEALGVENSGATCFEEQKMIASMYRDKDMQASEIAEVTGRSRATVQRIITNFGVRRHGHAKYKVMDRKKECSKCHVVQPVENYAFSKASNCLVSICRRCDVQRGRDYRERKKMIKDAG